MRILYRWFCLGLVLLTAAQGSGAQKVSLNLDAEYLGAMPNQIKSIKVGPDGLLYLATPNRILRRSVEGVYTEILGGNNQPRPQTLAELKSQSGAIPAREVVFYVEDFAFGPDQAIHLVGFPITETDYPITEKIYLARIDSNGIFSIRPTDVPILFTSDLRSIKMQIQVDEQGILYFIDTAADSLFSVLPDSSLFSQVITPLSFGVLKRFTPGTFLVIKGEQIHILNSDGSIEPYLPFYFPSGSPEKIGRDFAHVPGMGVVGGYKVSPGFSGTNPHYPVTIFFQASGRSPIIVTQIPVQTFWADLHMGYEGLYVYDENSDILYMAMSGDVSFASSSVYTGHLFRISGVKKALQSQVKEWGVHE